MFKILIAEDVNELCHLFQKVLEKQDYQVLCASDGKEVLELGEDVPVMTTQLGCALAVHLGKNLIGVCIQIIQ